ncbi:hypothetical protein TruAng_009570 [Truncatella angustata]|nr:hypothetical protein TruAng_009570 [Truncatella angustata]
MMAPTQVLCQPPLLSFTPQMLDWCASHGKYRMAAVSNPAPSRQPWSMNELSSELLALIFEHLRDVDAGSLATARLLSRRFDAIVTPIKYKFLYLSERILAPEAQAYIPDALEKIYVHTRHVQANSDLDPQNIKRLLDRIQRLSTVSPAPPLTNRLESLKQLLLRSRNLETFFYQDRGQGTHFTFSEDETLPSFKELVLRSYDWGHTETEVEDHWDFSSIRLLRLIDVPIFEFLRSVPFEDLTDLHTLQCDDFSAHLAADRRQEATRGLYCLVKKIRSLRDLEFTCHTQHFPLDALFHHGKSLHHLRIRDHVGFSDEDRRCPTIWPADLAALSQKMVKLETLELDMDTAYCDPPLFLEAICNFPRLHTLTLHVQTVLRALEVVHPDVDRDYEAAMRNFRALVRGKMGVSWRSITINVGGWKQHMVRRLSEAWRTQNAQGVYAERCFVLKRSAAGEITLREEMSFEH